VNALTARVDAMTENVSRLQLVLGEGRVPTFDAIYAFTKSAQSLFRTLDPVRHAPLLGAAAPKEVVKLSERVAVATSRLATLGKSLADMRLRLAKEKPEPTMAERKLFATTLIELAGALLVLEPLADLMSATNATSADAMADEPEASVDEVPEALTLIAKLHTEGFAPMLDRERLDERLLEVERRGVADRGPELLAMLRKSYGYSPAEKLILMGAVLRTAKKVTVTHADLLALAAEASEQIHADAALETTRTQLLGYSLIGLPNIHRLLAEIFASATATPQHVNAMAVSGDTAKWRKILAGLKGAATSTRRL